MTVNNDSPPGGPPAGQGGPPAGQGPPAGGAPPAGDGPGIDARLDRLEATVGTLVSVVQSGTGKAHDQAAAHEAAKLDRPTSIAEQVRHQLDERDRRDAEKTARDAERGRVAALEAKVAEMAETGPAPVARRVERLMGWS